MSYIIEIKKKINYRLVLKTFHTVNQLKPYIDMNTKLRKNGKIDFEKYFLQKVFALLLRGTTSKHVGDFYY